MYEAVEGACHACIAHSQHCHPRRECVRIHIYIHRHTTTHTQRHICPHSDQTIGGCAAWLTLQHKLPELYKGVGSSSTSASCVGSNSQLPFCGKPLCMSRVHMVLHNNDIAASNNVMSPLWAGCGHPQQSNSYFRTTNNNNECVDISRVTRLIGPVCWQT